MPSLFAAGSWRSDAAIDLGTSLTRVAIKDSALCTTPSVLRSRPLLRSGAIVDPEGAAEILRPFLTRGKRLGIFRPRAVAAAPSDATPQERETLIASVLAGGAASARIVSAPLAAAVGAGVDVSLPYAQMIVDVGEGVTDCIILRSGEIVQSRAARVGCGTLCEKIRDFLRRSRGVEPTAGEARAILAAAGVRASSAPKGEGSRERQVREEEIHAALEPALGEILGTASALLEEAPDRLGCEIIESGIVLTGGGALIPGMRESLAARTAIHVAIPSRPLDAVVLGLRDIFS